jgi:hypothetical protein
MPEKWVRIGYFRGFEFLIEVVYDMRGYPGARNADRLV